MNIDSKWWLEMILNCSMNISDRRLTKPFVFCIVKPMLFNIALRILLMATQRFLFIMAEYYNLNSIGNTMVVILSYLYHKIYYSSLPQCTNYIHDCPNKGSAMCKAWIQSYWNTYVVFSRSLTFFCSSLQPIFKHFYKVCDAYFCIWTLTVMFKQIWYHELSVAQSNCLNQYWLNICRILCHSPKGNSTGNVYEKVITTTRLKHYLFQIKTKYQRRHCVECEKLWFFFSALNHGQI